MNCNQLCINKIDNSFPNMNVIVIGDVMVDEYITGKVKRISPEAPVPVLEYKQRRLEAGGASNVAHNLVGLGATVSLIGIAALDDEGMWLRKHFSEMGVDTTGIIDEPGRHTTVKTRYATKGQMLLRMDREIVKGISANTKKEIKNILSQKLPKTDVVIISDYKKGTLEDDNFVAEIIEMCNKNNSKITIDSKSRNIKAFAGADFVKPNNLELEDAVGFTIDSDELLNKAGERYLKKSGAKALVVTRGADGISVFEPDKSRQDFLAQDVQVFDVCGAGDTVISVMSMAVASGLTYGEAAWLANYAAGIVICKVGTVAITSEELKRSISEK